MAGALRYTVSDGDTMALVHRAAPSRAGSRSGCGSETCYFKASRQALASATADFSWWRAWPSAVWALDRIGRRDLLALRVDELLATSEARRLVEQRYLDGHGACCQLLPRPVQGVLRWDQLL